MDTIGTMITAHDIRLPADQPRTLRQTFRCFSTCINRVFNNGKKRKEMCILLLEIRFIKMNSDTESDWDSMSEAPPPPPTVPLSRQEPSQSERYQKPKIILF